MLTIERCALPEGYIAAWQVGDERTTEFWAGAEDCPLILAWLVLRAHVDRGRRAP